MGIVMRARRRYRVGMHRASTSDGNALPFDTFLCTVLSVNEYTPFEK